MEKPKDGGPAFPERMTEGYDRSGMTLRDWFAGQAILSLLHQRCKQDGSFVGLEGPIDDGEQPLSDAQCIAEQAYILADAMLDERSKQ